MPPKKKKSRQNEPDNSSTASKDNPSSGFIRFEVDVSDITPNSTLSPRVEVQGTPWKLWVKKNLPSMELYLFHRKSDCDIWSFDVAAEFVLLNSDKGKNHIRQFTKSFNHEIPSWGFAPFIKWEDLINEDKGFIHDDKIIIEARFTLSNIVGVRVTPRIDFTDPDEPRHDIALVIEGQKIYVNKGILAVHSPVFNAMFYGQFVEKDKKEVELKEIDRQEFIVLLNLIYPTDQKISDVYAESLLKLADRFQIKTILDQVEQFLIDSTKLNVNAKLKLSDEYRLVKLQDRCLDSLKSVRDVQNLKTMDGYKELSKNIKGTLLEKMMKLK